MPPIEEDDCWDTVVYWRATGGSDAQGQPILADPVELTWPNGVRWVPSESRMMDPKGQLVNLDASAIVLDDIPIGSLMWLGCLEDWFGTGSGYTDTDRMEVKAFSRTPSLNGRFYRRTVGLVRYHR